jgi:hypothetical protein
VLYLRRVRFRSIATSASMKERDKWVFAGWIAGSFCATTADLVLRQFGLRFPYPWVTVLFWFVGMFFGFLIFKFIHRQDRPHA